MMSALRPGMLAAILRAGWQLRRNESGLWGQALVAAFLLLPAVLIAALAPAAKLWPGLSVWTAVCLQVVWLNQFSGYLRQNQPHAARLVPGHLLSLRLLTLGNWLLFALATALTLGLASGQPLALGLAAALVMLATAFIMRWPWLWLAIWLLPPLLGLLEQRLQIWQGLLAWALEQWQRQPLPVALLLMLAAAYGLAQLLQDGGDAHVRAHARTQAWRQAWRASLSGDRFALRQQGWIGHWMLRVLEIPFHWWTARLLRSRGARPAAVLARAELCLGAGSHWVTQLMSGGLLLLVGMATWMGARYFDWDLQMALDGGALNGLAIGLLSMAVNPVLALRAASYRSRREQALLMLVPGMPRGAQLNAMLARRQLRQCAIAWLAACLMLAGLNAALRTEAHFFGFAIAALPFCLFLLPDWSRLRQPSANQTVAIMLGMMALGGANVALLVWTPIGAWTLLALQGLPTGLLLVWRWRALARAPQAWPTGRLSASS